MGDKKKEYRDKRTGMQTVRSVIFAIVLIITSFTSIISGIAMDCVKVKTAFVNPSLVRV